MRNLSIEVKERERKEQNEVSGLKPCVTASHMVGLIFIRQMNLCATITHSRL